MTDPTPQRLGSFEIVMPLGEGGSAFVYAAKDGDREVALKVLRPDVGLDAREVDRFLEEAETMRRVKHRALVPVLRAGLLPGGRPYIAMPRLHGKTLAERIEAGPIHLERALALFGDIAEAVGLLHDSGLVHRDIKPENVFWLEKEDRLVLLDLGIARDTSGLPNTTTRAGMMRGTPAYMAPERFFGKSATIRSDVYELAVLLYVMVTAKLPWDDGDARGRIEPKPPSERGVIVSAALTRVLLDTLSFDIEKRPPTVAALREKIQEAVTFTQAATQPHSHTPFTPQPQPVLTMKSSYAAVTPMHGQVQAQTPPQAQAPAVTPTYAQAPYDFTPMPVNAGSYPYPQAQQSTGPRGVAIASVPPPPAPAARSGTSGWLLALGAFIALGGAAGGALVVGMLIRRGDSAQNARTKSDDRDDRDERRRDTDTVTPSVTAIGTASAAVSGAVPSPSASANGAPSASASTSTTNAQTPTAKSSGSASAPAPPSTSTSTSTSTAPAPAPAGGMPASCTQLITLMCSPSSGARPEECTAWKENVARWRSSKMSEAQVASTCAETYSVSKKGLELRKASKPP